MRGLLLLAIVLVAFGATRWAMQRPLAHAAGTLVSAEPRQHPPTDPAPVEFGDFVLSPLADFELEARVLSREDYRLGTESRLSPTDLALGWGRMSDSAVIGQLEISQSARFYHYRWRGEPPIPPRDIVRSSANMHLIPADAAVARELARVREGEVVSLRGRLVEARSADGWHWRSSLTREDSGAGACELVLVESLARLPRGSRAAVKVRAGRGHFPLTVCAQRARFFLTVRAERSRRRRRSRSASPPRSCGGLALRLRPTACAQGERRWGVRLSACAQCERRWGMRPSACTQCERRWGGCSRWTQTLFPSPFALSAAAAGGGVEAHHRCDRVESRPFDSGLRPALRVNGGGV